ncbi:MAG: MerR family DNA-binding protein [Egibacteraceae bacterium]
MARVKIRSDPAAPCMPRDTPAGVEPVHSRDVERLGFIRSAQRFGLTLDEIREVIAFRETGERPCDYVLETVIRRAEELDRRIADLLHCGRNGSLHPCGPRSWCGSAN